MLSDASERSSTRSHEVIMGIYSDREAVEGEMIPYRYTSYHTVIASNEAIGSIGRSESVYETEGNTSGGNVSVESVADIDVYRSRSVSENIPRSYYYSYSRSIDIEGHGIYSVTGRSTRAVIDDGYIRKRKISSRINYADDITTSGAYGKASHVETSGASR